jgi:hypothetical protein
MSLNGTFLVERRGERRGAYRIWWGNLRAENHLEDPGVDGRIILKYILKTWDGYIDWIALPQERDRWRALVHTLNESSGFHKMREIS